MACSPFPQSYWVDDERLLCAGQYPGALSPADRNAKLSGLLDCGVRRVINLMWPGETSRGGTAFEPYLPQLCELAADRILCIEWLSMPIRDASVPTRARMMEILAAIDDGLRRKVPTYLHCWGGHGRTSTVIACHLIDRGLSPQEAFNAVERLRADLPKNHYPFEGSQRTFVLQWPSVRQSVNETV